MIRELCRVTSSHVALSYISPVALLGLPKDRPDSHRKKIEKWSTPLPEIESYFRRTVSARADFAQLPLVHTLHVALFRRFT